MLARSARIIDENLWFYVCTALLVVALETVIRLGFLEPSSHAGILYVFVFIFVFVYLSANLPFVITQRIKLTATVSLRGHGRLAAGLKVALIAAILVGVSVYMLFKVLLDRKPVALMVASDYAAFLAFLVPALSAVLTLLGSWVPAGIMRKGPGLVSAIRRGVMSIHTVYWRLVLSFALFVFLASLLGTIYVIVAGDAPSLATDSGGPQALGIIYWYLTTLLGMMLFTYINVVICICYMRFEKIDLSAAAQAPTDA